MTFICWNCGQPIEVQEGGVAANVLAVLGVLQCGNCGSYGELDPASGLSATKALPYCGVIEAADSEKEGAE